MESFSADEQTVVGAMLAELEKAPHGGDLKSDRVSRMGKSISPYKEGSGRGWSLVQEGPRSGNCSLRNSQPFHARGNPLVNTQSNQHLLTCVRRAGHLYTADPRDAAPFSGRDQLFLLEAHPGPSFSLRFYS